MDVVAAILGLVAVVLLFLLVMTRRNASTAAKMAATSHSSLSSDLTTAQRARATALGDLDAARTAFETESAATKSELDAALASRSQAIERAAAAEAVQAEQLEKIGSLERYGVELKAEIAASDEAARAAEAKVEAAMSEAMTAQASLEDAQSELADARAAGGSGAATVDGGIDPELLWALEMTRSERTWRHSVAVDPDGPSPFPDAPDPLRFAVEVEAAALREEVGAFIHLRWEAEAVADPIRRLLVLRVANELLAAAAREPQPFEMVSVGADEIVLTVRSTEDGDRQIQLEPPRFGTDVIAYVADDNGISVTIK